MQFNKKFLIFLVILIFASMTMVSASDSNLTDIVDAQNDDSFELAQGDISQGDVFQSNSSEVSDVNKTTPQISISSNSVKSKDTLEFCLQNLTGSPIISKKLTVNLNNKIYSLKTDSNGIAKLTINLPAKTYKLTISFDGDANYTAVSKTFSIKVSKLKTKITESANFVVKGNYLYFFLTDSNGDSVSGKKVIIKFKGKTYTKKSNSNGRVGLKIKLPYKRYSITARFKGDSQFKSSYKKLKFYVTTLRSINIGNSKLLSNGYLRVYLKVNGKPISKKALLIVGGKKLYKKSNSEGIAVFKPGVKANSYTVKAKVGKYYSSKNLKCYDGNVKDPLSEAIPFINGKPDVDLMPANYVMGDGNAKYTLKASQYKEVLKRDSHCLFLYNKLTRYTFFKTKQHPKLNHIIKREKWNVIERAIYTKLVKKNQHNYWPGKITVSLKNKAYTYPEVRDPQDTKYTCGPTSSSVCSQVLKNYFCEKYLSKISKTTKSDGTSPYMIMVALNKHNFICEYFYKSTFNYALNELKKGGTALVFHAENHYVAIIDISNNGKKVLVSNSYGTYDNIPTKWIKVSYMKKKFSTFCDNSIIVKLNYKLSESYKKTVNNYYTSFGTGWQKHNTRQTIGRV